MANIQDTLKQAQEAAATAAAARTTLPATSSAPTMPGQAMSLASMMTGAITVDEWLKVKEFGILVGSHNTLHDTIKVQINLAEAAVNMTLRYGQNPATYIKSYDGATCNTGGSWNDAQAKAKSIDPNARPYQSVDIPMTLLEDLKSKGGEVEAAAGVTLGYATPTTGKGNFVHLLKAVAATGNNPDDSIVVVELGFEKKVKGSNTWGLMTFNLLDVLSEPQGDE